MFIKSALNLNGRICELLSHFQGNLHLLHTTNIKINQCNNIHLLHEPKYIQNFLDLNENTNLVKQRSEEWFELCKRALVTGSTMYNALGLQGRKELNYHFNDFKYKKHPH